MAKLSLASNVFLESITHHDRSLYDLRRDSYAQGRKVRIRDMRPGFHYIYTQGRPKNIGSIQWSVSESTILLVKVYDQQFQGTILLMVFDLQVCI